jgi:hypothetical protein
MTIHRDDTGKKRAILVPEGNIERYSEILWRTISRKCQNNLRFLLQLEMFSKNMSATNSNGREMHYQIEVFPRIPTCTLG